jgi:hypothetical protein
MDRNGRVGYAEEMPGDDRGDLKTIEVLLFYLRKARFSARWIFAAPRDPQNITLTSSAMKNKFHPATWILQSRATPSTLTNLHSPKQGSVSSPSNSGIPGHSFIKIVAT